MKTIIAGTRTIEDYQFLADAIIMSGIDITEVVSGGCRGPDLLGEKWAKENNIPIKRFDANWKKYGKSAGPRRNDEMVIYADSAIFIWDGKSKGTSQCIKSARQSGLLVYVYVYTTGPCWETDNKKWIEIRK